MGAESTAKQVNDSVWLERCVRAGLVAYGVVHVLIGALALQLAWGSRSQGASQQGALHALAQEPLGRPLLWAVAVSLAALVVWQGSEAVVGHRNLSSGKRRFLRRVVSAGRAVVYAGLGYSAIATAVGSQSSGAGNDQLTARLLDVPFGQLLVALLGAAIVGVGVGLAWQCVSQTFLEELEPEAQSGSTGTALVTLGRFGYAMKGLAIAIVGGLFVWAAATYDARKAGGLDIALQTLTTKAVGPWLLSVVAIGIGCFGVYCFGWARYADTAA